MVKKHSPAKAQARTKDLRAGTGTGESKTSRLHFHLSPSQSTFNTLGAPASTGVTAPWVPREQTPVGLQYHRVIL